jgi:hypothetical protein
MDRDTALAENRARIEQFLAAAADTAAAWTTPVRPGKWSPAELTRHIEQGFLETGGFIRSGTNPGFPKIPRLLRPLARKFGLDPVLRTGRFPRPLKTFKSLIPSGTAATPAAAAAALRATWAEFETIVRAYPGDMLDHPSFGRIPLADYLMFLAYHTTHHQAQLKA